VSIGDAALRHHWFSTTVYLSRSQAAALEVIRQFSLPKNVQGRQTRQQVLGNARNKLASTSPLGIGDLCSNALSAETVTDFARHPSYRLQTG
jgi:hypothetical protein